METIQWKPFWILLAVGMLGIGAIWPILLLVHGSLLYSLAIPLVFAFLIYTAKSAIFLSGIILLGLILGRQVGLGLAYIPRLLKGKALEKSLLLALIIPLLLGMVAGTSILIGDAAISVLGNARTTVAPGEGPIEASSPEAPGPIVQTITLTPEQGFLAALYGATVEEMFLRFFFMTLCVWVLQKVVKGVVNRIPLYWLGIFLAALLSGLVHVVVLASFPALTPFVLFRIWLLGIVPACIFGWLYWKKGFESAILAHFTAELFVFVIAPLLG